jgi:hypothetical protein
MTGDTIQGGSLFQTIQYENDESLGKFLDNLQLEQAHLIIEESLRFAFRNGIFDLKESEAISKSLRIINKK